MVQIKWHPVKSVLWGKIVVWLGSINDIIVAQVVPWSYFDSRKVRRTFSRFHKKQLEEWNYYLIIVNPHDKIWIAGAFERLRDIKRWVADHWRDDSWGFDLPNDIKSDVPVFAVPSYYL